MKIAINRCYGEFSLSPQALKYWMKLKNKPCYFFVYSYKEKKYKPIKIKKFNPSNWTAYTVKNPKNMGDEINYIDKYSIDRTDNELIQTIDKLGDKANGDSAKLKVIEIPDDIEWEIDNHDGIEMVREKTRCWN